MTKSDVLNAVQYWTPGAWDVAPDFAPRNLSSSEQGVFTAAVQQAIGRLYDASPQVAAIFDGMAAAGSLRIGKSNGQGPAFYISAKADIGNDSYILFDPLAKVFSINANGTTFEMDNAVVLSHEVAHSIGKVDSPFDEYTSTGVGLASDAFLNSSSYIYTPDVVDFENAVASELGISNHRLSYAASFVENDYRWQQISQIAASSADGLTGGMVMDIIRIGDQDLTNAERSDFSNDIDFSGWSSNPNVLAFGFNGNDSIVGSRGGNNWLYGGDGNDSVTGGENADFLFGQAGDDLLSGNGGNDSIYGGDGADIIDGGVGSNEYGILDQNILDGGNGDDAITSWAYDWIDAGAGDDTIFVIGPANRIFAGEGNDIIDVRSAAGSTANIFGQGGDDLFDVQGTAGLLSGGDGSDTFIMSGSASAGIDPGAGDDLIDVSGMDQFSGSVALTFTPGFGHDVIRASDSDGYARSSGGPPIDHWHTDNIRFAGATASDITVRWDPTIFYSTAITDSLSSINAYGDVLITTENGDTLSIAGVNGSWTGSIQDPDFSKEQDYGGLILELPKVYLDGYQGKFSWGSGIRFENGNSSSLAMSDKTSEYIISSSHSGAAGAFASISDGDQIGSAISPLMYDTEDYNHLSYAVPSSEFFA